MSSQSIGFLLFAAWVFLAQIVILSWWFGGNSTNRVSVAFEQLEIWLGGALLAAVSWLTRKRCVDATD